MRNGIRYRTWQRYFLARVTRFEIDTSGFEGFEAARNSGRHRWSLDEPRTTAHLLRPDGLAGHFADLPPGGTPDRPVIVNG